MATPQLLTAHHWGCKLIVGRPRVKQPMLEGQERSNQLWAVHLFAGRCFIRWGRLLQDSRCVPPNTYISDIKTQCLAARNPSKILLNLGAASFLDQAIEMSSANIPGRSSNEPSRAPRRFSHQAGQQVLSEQPMPRSQLPATEPRAEKERTKIIIGIDFGTTCV